jgi:hypothetical protein
MDIGCDRTVRHRFALFDHSSQTIYSSIALIIIEKQWQQYDYLLSFLLTSDGDLMVAIALYESRK